MNCLAFRNFSSLKNHFRAAYLFASFIRKYTLRIIASRYCVVKVLSPPYLVPTLLVATIRK